MLMAGAHHPQTLSQARRVTRQQAVPIVTSKTEEAVAFPAAAGATATASSNSRTLLPPLPPQKTAAATAPAAAAVVEDATKSTFVQESEAG